jgi:hypothetical protein
MPLIDTLTLKTDLLEGGMPEPQAAAIVKALASADTSQLATKADLAELRAELRTEIEVLRGDIKMLRWMGGVILAFQLLVFGKLFFT